MGKRLIKQRPTPFLYFIEAKASSLITNGAGLYTPHRKKQLLKQ